MLAEEEVQGGRPLLPPPTLSPTPAPSFNHEQVTSLVLECPMFPCQPPTPFPLKSVNIKHSKYIRLYLKSFDVCDSL